jgi:hypothetical protein
MLRRLFAATLLVGIAPSLPGGCDRDADAPQASEPEHQPVQAEAAVVQPAKAPAPEEKAIRVEADGDIEIDPDNGIAPESDIAIDTPRVEPPPLPDPIDTLVSRRGMMIHAEPSWSAPFRGRIAHGQPFHLYERVEGGDPACKRKGWGRVGVAAYVCLQHAEPTKAKPVEIPFVHKGMLTPFHWARRRMQGEPPPRWKHRASWERGNDPIDTLDLEHDYAFTHRKKTSRGRILVDRNFRVVQEADVKRLEPSKFKGRDLKNEPVPEGNVLAWVVDWPGAVLLAEPREEAKSVGQAKFQTIVYLASGDPVVRRREKYFQVATDPPSWVNGKEIRRWDPQAPPEGIGEAEIWMDIDLGQHVLTIYEGAVPTYATVVASGSTKNPTPTGVFRIQVKHAWGDMRSLPGEQDEPYYVEAVPWVMYFKGRYALHGTFWHNRFGFRLSHGCVNLAPQDAAHVYSVTRPDPLPGWSSAYEHKDELGTLLRIRRGEEVPEDKRREPRERRPS